MGHRFAGKKETMKNQISSPLDNVVIATDSHLFIAKE